MDQDAWERLFETDGYAKYLASNRSGALRAMIQEAVLVAFSPDRHAEADSLLRLTPDANDYQALMSKNFCELAARQEDAVRFLTETDFPALLDRAEPVIEYADGWDCDISGVRRFEDLPPAAQRYVNRIEAAIGCPVTYISVGAERGSIILRQKETAR